MLPLQLHTFLLFFPCLFISSASFFSFNPKMDLQNFFKFQNTLHLFIIFTTLVHATLSVDPKFEACVPRNCGKGPNISYPFWIPHEQQSYCGHPNFEITCNDQNPVLAISNDDYIVRDIFYANHSFFVTNAVFYDHMACPTPLQNFSVVRTPFNYSTSRVDLYLFYNCTSEPTGYYTYPVQCASNTKLHSFGVFHEDGLEATAFATESCQSSVNVPVDFDVDNEFKSLLKMNYTEILKKGFHLSWAANNCSICKKSGGRCGFDNNEFSCFCVDRPHLKTCDDGKHRKGINWKVKLGIGFGTAGFTCAIMFVVFFIYQRRNRKKYVAPSSYVSRNISSDLSSMSDLEKMGSYFGVHLFTYEELEEATNNFDSSKELGDGGFGTVYYGKLRDGRVVAVKRLYESNYKRVEQFMNEVEILTRLRHKNLVLLYGCTSRHSRELLLVYEYISNGTVSDHLHGERAKPGSLPWPIRLKIAIETASALAYLHASDIIHRDVKTNNILLDDHFCVKVADFGLSRLFPTDVTHISTAPQGTPGYVDPDYHQCYQLTDKSDVYSFGVVLIELISSKPAVDITRHRHEINLSNMAINKIQNRELHELVDPSIGFESDCTIKMMVTAVAALAFQCLQSEKDMRPTMEEVFESLKDILQYNEKPAEDVNIPADDVEKLKSVQPPLPLSPVSVTANWIISSSSTPNGSG